MLDTIQTTPIDLPKYKVFLTQPTRDEFVHKDAAFAFDHPSTGKLGIQWWRGENSLLTMNFNAAWCGMLNERSKFTHFAMLHGDVIPQAPIGRWLEILIEEMDAVDADVMSAVVPIRNTQGLTSTGIDAGPDQFTVRRIALDEIFKMPETFTAPNLLVNTGCWVCRVGDWCERICFHQGDRIVKNRDGVWVAQTSPEDWDFSRQAHELGLKVFATRKLPITHGHGWCHTGHAWGLWKTDELFFKLTEPDVAAVA